MISQISIAEKFVQESYNVYLLFSDFNFYMLANVPFGVGTLSRCVPQEDGIQVLATLMSSSHTLASLLRTSWLAKPAEK